jgi:hypothetical protein
MILIKDNTHFLKFRMFLHSPFLFMANMAQHGGYHVAQHFPPFFHVLRAGLPRNGCL